VENPIFRIKNLLLQNSSVNQTIFKNTFWLSLAELISQALGVVVIIFVARILGATEYGKFSFALALVSMFVILSDLGISTILTREITQDKKSISIYPSIFSLKFFLSLATLILLAIISLFVTEDLEIRKVIWILTVWILLDNFTLPVFAIIRAYEKMEYEAGIKILKSTILATLTLIIIFSTPSIVILSFAYLATGLLGLSAAAFIFHYRIQPFSLKFETSTWLPMLKKSWPITFSSIFALIYVYSDSIMMGYWEQITQTGWYNASYRIIFAALIPVTIIAHSFFPTLSKLFKQSVDQFKKVWQLEIRIMIIIAIPLVTGGIVLSSKIIDFLYGGEYSPSVLAFKILVVMSGLVFLSQPLSSVLIIAHHQKKIFYIAGIGAIVNILLNLILIPKFSLYGAAMATLLTYSLLLILLLLNVHHYIHVQIPYKKILRSSIAVIISTIAMYFIITYNEVYNLNVLITILIGTIIYIFCFFGINKLLENNKSNN